MKPSYFDKETRMNWKKIWEWLKKREMSFSKNKFTLC